MAKVDKILIVSGSYLVSRDNTFSSLIQKQLSQLKKSQHAWLEILIKVFIAQFLAVNGVWKMFIKLFYKNHPLSAFLADKQNQVTPSLTEVSLATLITIEGLQYEAITIDELISGHAKVAKFLEDCSTVFISTTFLRDLSELEPLLPLLKRPHNKIVVGGPLAATYAPKWKGHPQVDLLAVGYGEMLVPEITKWIQSDFQILSAPVRGRKTDNGGLIIYSGVPETLSLDEFPTPDWKLAESYYKEDFSNVFYESVRGCPYRCAFCNYPYLFDDNKFRVRSAKKMADDWEYLARELKVEFITCLDSLFTMPRQRMREFCIELIERKIVVKWICYARADDMVDEELCELMKKAGVLQVHIGIESGDNQQLANMNKRTDVATNLKAIVNCRKYGITSIVTLICGFPGETKASLENTLNFMTEASPDFHFVIPFSVRAENVPILSPESRAKYDLITMDNSYSMSPYWKHSSMDCLDSVVAAKWLTTELVLRQVSIEAASFNSQILAYDPKYKESLLKLQHRSFTALFPVIWFFDLAFLLCRWAQQRDLSIWLVNKQEGRAT